LREYGLVSGMVSSRQGHAAFAKAQEQRVAGTAFHESRAEAARSG